MFFVVNTPDTTPCENSTRILSKTNYGHQPTCAVTQLPNMNVDACDKINITKILTCKTLYNDPNEDDKLKCVGLH